MASFRRPLFAFIGELFPFIHKFSDDPRETWPLPVSIVDELLVAALLAPLAYTNLRAQVRPSISITDASEEGGGAAVATVFRTDFNEAHADEREARAQRMLLNTDKVVACSPVPSCFGCQKVLAKCMFRCIPACGFKACSLVCWAGHAASSCPGVVPDANCVVCIGNQMASQGSGNVSRLWLRAKLF